MRCTFCATGKGGFARNLLPHEIVDQVLTVAEAFGQVRRRGVCAGLCWASDVRVGGSVQRDVAVTQLGPALGPVLYTTTPVLAPARRGHTNS